MFQCISSLNEPVSPPCASKVEPSLDYSVLVVSKAKAHRSLKCVRVHLDHVSKVLGSDVGLEVVDSLYVKYLVGKFRGKVVSRGILTKWDGGWV